MKKVEVTFGSDGKISTLDNQNVYFEGEDQAICISAEFPIALEIDSIRAYIRTNSGAQSYAVPTLTDGAYELVLSDSLTEKGVLKVAYEVTSGTEIMRFAPVTLNINGFISDDFIIADKLYTVSVELENTVTLESNEDATVENLGNSKEVKLKFSIPKGIQGEQGIQGETGADGYSPTVAVTNIIGGHNVTVTDGAGNHSFDVMDGVGIKKYGAKRLKTSTSPTLTRIWNAEGLTAAAGVDATTVTNDFDSIYPWSHMKRCNISVVDSKIIINAYEGEPTYATDGTNGQVAVEIPEFYYCLPDIEGDDYETFGVSEFSIGGWFKSEKMYVGAYTASADGDTKLKSISGVGSLVNTSRAEFRTLAAASDELCQLIDMKYINALRILFTVEFATLNSQSVMMGIVSNSSSLNTGACDNVVASSGSTTSNSDGTNACKYRGIENPWGNLMQFVDGVINSTDTIYICENKSNFADIVDTSYVALNYAKPSTSGFVKSLGHDERYPYCNLATETTGTDSTFFCDYQAENNSPVIVFGGTFTQGARCGIYCFFKVLSLFTGATSSARLLWREV